MSEATGHLAGTLHRVLGLRPGGQALHGQTSRWRPTWSSWTKSACSMPCSPTSSSKPSPRAPAPGRRSRSAAERGLLATSWPISSSRAVPVRLTHIFRQGAGSGIAANASRINAGQLPRFGGGTADCFFLPARDPTEAAQIVVDLVAERLPAHYGFQVGEVQVLADARG